jgi:hypothetical protein
MPPTDVYAITTAAATVVMIVTSCAEVALSTWPKARTCAPAHITELGTITSTASFSARGPKRSRNKSPSVVMPRFHNGTAKTRPSNSKQPA